MALDLCVIRPLTSSYSRVFPPRPLNFQWYQVSWYFFGQESTRVPNEWYCLKVCADGLVHTYHLAEAVMITPHPVSICPQSSGCRGSSKVELQALCVPPSARRGADNLILRLNRAFCGLIDGSPRIQHEIELFVVALGSGTRANTFDLTDQRAALENNCTR